MKKLLLTFLPLLLVVLGGFTATAQDFSVTVTWTVPGSIEVIKGGNPTLSSAVKQTLAPGQTSFTVTETDAAYWFKPTEGYTLEDASYNERNKSSILKVGTDTYYKLDPTYSKWKDLNGLTISLTTGLVEYDGNFTLDIANGADMVSLTMYDSNGDATRTITPQDGKTTVPLIKGETTLWIKTSSYKAIYEVKLGNEVIAWASFRYTVPITKDCVVYIAGTDPALVSTKYNVTFKFANNNPGCVKSVRNWTSGKFVEDFAAGFEVVSGTILQVNKEDNGDYTFNSFTANGKEARFNEKITIEENTEFVIDATTKVYPSLSTTAYITDIEGVTFSNSQYDTSAKEITVTKVADRAANTVSLGSYNVKVPTTEYTLGDISGKTRNVFFDIKEGYWLKEGVYARPEEPDMIYFAGASAFSVDQAPVYLNIGKINFDTPVKIYYQGPANTARLRAKYSGGGDLYTVTYEGANADGSLSQGWSEIKIDPEYDSFFELSMPKEGATAKYERFACLDGKVLVPNSDEADAPGVYQNIVFKDNSIIYVFFQEETPKAHTITFLTAGDAKASLSNGGVTFTDFSKPIVGYGDMEYTLTPEAGTKVLVNGKEVASGKYTFTAQGGSTTKIQLVKEGFGTLACSTEPASGSTVKTLESIDFVLEMSNFEQGSSVMLVNDAATWISLSNGTANLALKSVEAGEPTEAGVPVAITLAKPVTTAGTYTLTIPAGVAYETIPSADWSSYDRTAQSRVNPDMEVTITVDPNMVYQWTIAPAAGSENDMPEDDVIITLSLPQVKTLSSEAFEAGNGPWLTYNGESIARSEDFYTKPGWDYTMTMATYGKPAIAIAISKEIFKLAGELVITADEGAFTVNGSEASPELNYSAKFGKTVEYTYEFTPAANTEITDWTEFTLTFPEAKTVTVDEANAYFVFMQGYSWGTMDVDVTTNGNTVTLKPVSSSAPKAGALTFRIGEGTFIIDGVNRSPEISSSWTLKRTTPVNFEWNPDPTGNIVNEGYGIYAAIGFDESETVKLGDNFRDIVVKFNDAVLPSYDWENEDVMGKEVVTEGYNVLLINVYGGDEKAEGKLSVSIPAGALLISGEPNPEAINYTWTVVAKKDFTYVITPAPDSTVKELSSLTIEFTNATTAVLHDSFVNGWIGVWKGYSMVASATSVEAVAGAEHPTFKVMIDPITEAGNYRITFSMQTFYLDNAQGSDFIEAKYVVDPNYSGIEGVDAESGLFTVYNLQGILVLRDAAADELKALPAGIYIVNGKKVALK